MVEALSSRLHVAFCGDADVELGLFAAVASLLSSNRRAVELYILTDSRNGISKTLFSDAFGGRTTIHFIDVDTQMFEKWCPLVGNRFAYSKLLIPELIDADKVLYLDADTITDTDLSALWDEPMQDAPLKAVREADVRQCYEGEFLGSCGLRESDVYYNTGVLLFNATLWRRRKLVSQALRFARSHALELKTADQTVFNALFSRDIIELETRFNVRVYPTSDLSGVDPGCCILHFSGGLKPWDPFASKIHNGFPLWSRFLDRGYSSRFRRRTVPQSALRCMRLWRYYWTTIRAKWA